MAPLVVDPEALDSAGAKVISLSEGLEATVSTLTSALADCRGMSGDDPVGAAFGHSYDTSASKLLEAMATTRNGLSRLGDGVRVSAHNYAVAEANSNLAGGSNPYPKPPQTNKFSTGSSPTSIGHGVGPPAGWGWVSKYIGMVWPTADPAKLRGAAAAWTRAGTGFEVNDITGAAGPMITIGGQRIPEGPAIAAAFTETHRCAAKILQQCAVIATQLSTYATKVDAVHAAITDLLSRICNPLTGIKEVWEFLTHDDEDEIRKIAHDIRVVVNHFTAEVETLRTRVASAVNEAATVLTTMAHYAEKEWDHFLHSTDVGRALDHLGQICEGAVKEAEDTVKGLWTLNPARAIVDPQGFCHSLAGALDNLERLSGCDGEQALEDAWKQLGKDAVHWDEWGTNPFKAAGESAFDLGTLLLPGGALEKLPTIARAATEVADAPKSLHLPEPARLPNPAPQNSAPARNDPPLSGQPGPAPKAANGLPAYGLTDSKPASTTTTTTTSTTTTTTQKPSAAGDLRQSTNGDRLRPSLLDRDGTSWSTQRPIESADIPQTVPAATAPASSQQPYLPTAVADSHESDRGTAPPHELTDAKRDEILATPKGSRPDPRQYLTPEYVEQHLDKFHDGVTRFMSASNLDKYGIAQYDGTAFVMPSSEADDLVAATRGDPRATEAALGLVNGFLNSNTLVRIDINCPEEFDLRLPSGNEAGANDKWLPGGLLPNGGSAAVINGGDVPRPGYLVTEVG